MNEAMRKYLADIGAKGGSRSTPAKSAANSENGKKGGWPKGKPRKSIPLDERSKKVAELKAQGKIKEAKGIHTADTLVCPDEYSQEHPDYDL